MASVQQIQYYWTLCCSFSQRQKLNSTALHYEAASSSDERNRVARESARETDEVELGLK